MKNIVFSIAVGVLFSVFSTHAQTCWINFETLELDEEGNPVTHVDNFPPLTKPSIVSHSERDGFYRVRFEEPLDGQLALSMVVEAGEEDKSQFGQLKWEFNRTDWSNTPIRIAYTIIPNQSNKEGGYFGIKFHSRSPDIAEKTDGAFLGTKFAKNAKIEFLNVSGDPRPYEAGNTYQFEWILNLESRTASLSVNGEQWLMDVDLPEHWITHKPFAFVVFGQNAGMGVDARWDFGELIVDDAYIETE